MIPLDQREFMGKLTGEHLLTCRPFARDGWDCVTDGTAVLRLRGATFPENPAPPLDKVLSAPRPVKRRTSLASLREWAELGGPYRDTCDYCETEREVPEVDRQLFGEYEINRCLLWRYLEGVPGDDEPVEVSWGERGNAILIKGADWDIAIAPLHPAETNEEPFEFDDDPDQVAEAMAKEWPEMGGAS